MNLRFMLIEAAAAALIFGGCGRTVISCNGDELNNTAWRTAPESRILARLEFGGQNATLTVEGGSDKALIEGLCVIDDNTIVILDDDDKYIFDYKLSGKTLTLYFDNAETDFIRDDSPDSSLSYD